jgi:hypothetical protein
VLLGNVFARFGEILRSLRSLRMTVGQQWLPESTFSMSKRRYYSYIMASRSWVLYVGMTNNLARLRRL